MTDAAVAKICKEVGVAVREVRIRKGLSISAVAAKAGLSRPMVGYVEQGVRVPTIGTLLRLAEALDLNASVLLEKAIKAGGQGV